MNIMPSLASKIIDQAERSPEKYGKVAVLMGGYAEYEVSLQSGQEVLKALKTAGIDAHEVLVQPDNHWLLHLMQKNFDRAFIALHGKIGEDGTVQGALEIANIPYTGSDVCASAIAMHKLRTKQIWQALGLPSLPYFDISEKYDAENIIQQFGLPLAVKASCSGSTLGITKVKHVQQFPDAYELAKKYDNTVLVEPWIQGTEYTVPILHHHAMPSTRIEPKQEYYDYTAKYLDDDTGFFCPSGLSDADELALRHLAEQAYHSLGCRDFGRVDFIRDQEGKFWLMEVNTIPGLTTHSLLPRPVKALGYTFTDLILSILSMTLAR